MGRSASVSPMLNNCAIVTMTLLVNLNTLNANVNFTVLNNGFLRNITHRPRLNSRLRAHVFVMTNLLSTVPVVNINVTVLLLFTGPLTNWSRDSIMGI